MALVRLQYTATSIAIVVEDDGIGIFRKLQSELGLEDARHIVLELSKGKLTTDPERYAGEGDDYGFSRTIVQVSLVQYGDVFPPVMPSFNLAYIPPMCYHEFGANQSELGRWK
jgi:hypothetical protein